MKKFMDNDFLLKTDTAKALFENYASNPMFSFTWSNSLSVYAVENAYIPNTNSTNEMLISETKYEPANLLFVDLFSEYIVRYLRAKIKFLFYR